MSLDLTKPIRTKADQVPCQAVWDLPINCGSKMTAILWRRPYSKRLDVDVFSIDALENVPEDPSVNAAKAAVAGILADCLDRRGIKQQFEQCDDDVLEEIRREWESIVLKYYQPITTEAASAEQQ